MRIKNLLYAAVSMMLTVVLLSCNSNKKSDNSQATSETQKDYQNYQSPHEYSDEESLILSGEGYITKGKEILPTTELPTIIDFYADWCPPCRMLHPILEKIALQYKGKISIVRINIDENPEIASTYVGSGIPTLVYMNKDGEVLATTEGYMDLDKLTEYINGIYKF
ncbi:MAG: thioredoxin fold domain-containing protein [Muribaculaceae bacterium]|nr:thioredoxin fold domain-containing protein [Muribaculaceae bacterium]